jgi:hypothetical protein
LGVSAFYLAVSLAVSIPANQQLLAKWFVSEVAEKEFFTLKSEWMDRQLVNAFRKSTILLQDSWQDYRVVEFPNTRHQLVCAPAGGKLSTGFVFPGRDGLRTVRPWDEAIAFRLDLLCSIRI